MIADPQDTIVALSSAPGAGGRAIVRLSGPQPLQITAKIFRAAGTVLPDRRHCYQGAVCLSRVHAPLPADLYVWPGPRTYTGQEMTELHCFSCPPLVDLLIAQLMDAGARAAQPGEFTLRAFLAGKLDLPRAEAVLAIIEAGSRDQLKDALAQLAGGITRPLGGLREDLLNLLSDIEAALDFSDEDIQFVEQRELLLRLSRGLAQVTLVQKQLEQRSVGGAAFRVVLAGRPNAGKSSLFNALIGSSAALISPTPGTTRDYLVRRLELDDTIVELVDTAGRQQALNTIDEQAQDLGRRQTERADLVLLCLESGQPLSESDRELLERSGMKAVIGVATKCDLAAPPAGFPATSAVTGAGLAELRTLLGDQAKIRGQPPLVPSLSRCRHHVDACLEHLRRAHAAVLFADPAEVLALELRGALEQLGTLVGAVYTDDLLDRIFSRFCIGK